MWRHCLFELKEEKSSGNDLAGDLFDSLLKRSESMFVENDCLLCALYVDPRFNNSQRDFLSKERKERAVVS